MSHHIMRTLAVILIVAAAHATDGGESFEDAFAPETELMQAPVDNEVSDLMSAVNKLRENAPEHLHEHMDLVTKHAKALQLSQDDSDDDSDDYSETPKAKSYTHDFETASKAIKAALATLRTELQSGHNHDVDVLKTAKSTAGNTLASSVEGAKNKVKGLKHEGCPTKRAEEKADEDKAAAKKTRDDVKGKKICPLDTTWDDMDIHKTVPKYGSELRNAWDKARAEWVTKDNALKAATTAHEASIVAHEAKMAAFTTAVTIEAQAAHDQCGNAHEEYAALKRDVESNVNTRKQVDTSSKVVECYVTHMTDNAAAKTCADTARAADVSIWNIDGGKLDDCDSKESLENAFGPKSWTATKANCAPPAEEKEEASSDDESLLEELEF